MKKNKVLTNSAKYSIEEKKTESQTFVTVLTIINVVSNDYGSYLCVAHSEMGNVTEKAILSGKRKYYNKNHHNKTQISN